MSERSDAGGAAEVSEVSNEWARYLVCLDIDGTLLHRDGTIPEATSREVKRLLDEGHEVMIATGRSFQHAVPISDRLGMHGHYMVCSNGAMVFKRDATAAQGYSLAWSEVFDPREVLLQLRDSLLSRVCYAVETPEGTFLCHGSFPDGSFEAGGREVSFEELYAEPVCRLVVVSPDQTSTEFGEVIARLGLHQVSYSVGWTAWLDIAPLGVDKGVALERVRKALEIPRDRVVAAGDGHNDVEMLAWAAAEGTGISMPEGAQRVIDAGNVLADKFTHDGLAKALARAIPAPKTDASSSR